MYLKAVLLAAFFVNYRDSLNIYIFTKQIMVKALSDMNQIKTVFTFSELVYTNFQGDNNAICWERNLDGDFKEIVSKLQLIGR